MVRCLVAERRSGLKCNTKRRWSGISGDYDVELKLIGIHSLLNPAISRRAWSILGRGQGYKGPHVSPTDRTQHNTTRSTMSMITSMLECSAQLWSICDPFNVRVDTFAALREEILDEKENNKTQNLLRNWPIGVDRS